MKENNIKLSKVERLQLINQFKILSLLENTDTYQNNIEILKNGYEFDYREVLDDYIWDGIEYNVSESVHDIIGMFCNIYGSKKQLKKEDLEEVEKFDKYNYLDFNGFDGNNESKYLSYVNYLQEENQYEEILCTENKFKQKKWNSHARMVNIYEKLLSKYSKIEKDFNWFPMNKNQLIELVNQFYNKDLE